MILPGSLDYLYNYGVIDHVPYEAYEMVAPSPSYNQEQNGFGQIGYNSADYTQMNSVNNINSYGQDSQYSLNQNNKYINSAKQGSAYKNSAISSDTFVPNNNIPSSKIPNSYSVNNGFENNLNADYQNGMNVHAVGSNDAGFVDSVNDGVGKVYDKFNSMSAFVKGLISGGIILSTLYLILRKKH